ncbi:MAG: flagellar biosynthesis anti-sigma factor FlgM [Kofleriaceae bacterium]|jgi:anti-sigma28 factor (negative regulator of flagellin synthesis)|nr:flagellar biosynthesis anti-sigma factor FlgM [Kofleriaceae bacterium]MBP6840235.1 flagellar biosynthesis anti-sigma factor FlgM [Kofleriaceae bacterium]MBP9204769.1 flagellar biosynthesis anti-sigma factor FlgM [Kofleriaceae bacterium]
MRIDPSKLAPITEPKPRDPRAAERDRSTPSSVVELTASSDGGSAIESGIAERIARVRELISTGQYAVDLDKLAERIVDDDLTRSR